MIVTSKLTHGILKVYSWLSVQSAVVTLNMQAPPSTLSCAVLALRLFRSLPPMPITSQSSGRERAQLSQLSSGGFSNSELRMQNTAESHEYWPSDATADFRHCQVGSLQFGSQYLSAPKSSIKRAQNFFLIVLVPLFSSLLYTAK